VRIEGLEDVANPSYRLGDKIRNIKHSVAGDEEVIKNVFVEVGFGDDVQTTNPFAINTEGKVKLGATLFVKCPPRGQPLTFSVKKEHKIQKDALIGSVDIKSTTNGKQRLRLMRHEKPRGFIIVDVTDGISTAATPSASASTASGVAMLPSAALRSAQTPSNERNGASASREVTGGMAGSVAAGCMDCISGVMELLGLRDGDAAFLRAKEADPKVIKLDSGLMYKVIKKGHGKGPPTSHDNVKCHYTGRFVNGKVFDSSMANGGEPIVFQPGSVIQGWKEALGRMVEGDKWELYIPGHLAYGADGDPSGRIKPNATLWFEMELVRIMAKR